MADGSGHQYRSGLKDVVFRSVGRSVGEFGADADSLPWTFSMDSHPVRGYWVLERNGYVHGFGDAADYDSSTFGPVNFVQHPYINNGQPPYSHGLHFLLDIGYTYAPPKSIAMAAHPSGEGYWIIDVTGTVYAFGAAQDHGSFPVPYRGETIPLLGVGAMDIASTHTGNGYWVLYSDGSVRGFGDATPTFAQVPMTAMTINMMNSGRGYKYLYYADNPLGIAAGEVSSAGYRWSRMGTAIASHPRKMGFWVTDGSGQIFTFGDVEFFGQLENRTYHPGGADSFSLEYNNWPHGLVSTKTGNGYWIAFTTGRIAAFGDAVNQGVNYVYESNPQITFVADGNFPDVTVFQQLVWDIARDPDGQGFWVLIANGSVRNYNAKYWGQPGWWGKSGFRWVQGNFKEYVDIVKDMLCWSGFTYYNSEIQSIINIPVNTFLVSGDETPPDWTPTPVVHNEIVVDDYTLKMQTDGNLTLTNTATDTVVWQSNTGGNPGAVALFQGDGNFVIYKGMDQITIPDALWWTITEGNFGARMILRYDGYFGVMSKQGADLWVGYPGSPDPIDRPSVLGNTESTGIFTDIELPGDKFDKRTALDCINEIKQVVGYNFFIDQDGAARFESPNWWSAGNFDDVGQKIYVVWNEDGTYTRVNKDGATYPDGAELFIPEIHEAVTLKAYQAGLSGDSLRSEIIIGSDAPDPNNPKATSFVRFVPPSSNDEIRPGVPALRNIVRPAIWIDNTFKKKEEQQLMAELINLQIWFSQRTGSVTCVADPNIQINDQIKIVERNTSETYIHYVRGISTTMDLDSGAYEMTLTTNWLGNEDDWVITSDNVYNPITHVSITEKVDKWQLTTGRDLQFSGLGQKPVTLTGKFV
ncbi:MAG: hypothetical protein EBU08_00290 [Micrococcales bacterium]|nr:hypothetical protein [Micrococcales bacterium]